MERPPPPVPIFQAIMLHGGADCAREPGHRSEIPRIASVAAVVADRASSASFYEGGASFEVRGGASAGLGASGDTR